MAKKRAKAGVSAVTEKQKQDVVDWMLEGHDGHEILTRLVDEYPRANVNAVLAAAAEHFETASSPAYHRMLKGWALESTRFVYQKLIDAGDFPNALKAIKQLREMID